MDTTGDTDETAVKTFFVGDDLDETTIAANAVLSQMQCDDITTNTPICFRDCKHGDDRRFSQIRCALCTRQFHAKCVNEQDPHYDPRLSYRCDTCKQFPANIMLHIDALSTAVQSMARLHHEMHRDLSRKLDDLSTQIETTKHDNEELRVKVVDLTTKLQRQHWPTHRPEHTVVVGTSLLKHMDEGKLQNTSVLCLPGAKLDQVANTIIALPPDTVCDKMVILAGGNDVAEIDELQDAVDAYQKVVTEAKKRCVNVAISSVLPRMNNADFTDKIDRFNAQLCKMAEDHQCLFVNQHDAFHLASGKINDGYYDDDVHPNLKGTNMIADAFGLKCSSPNSRDIATRDAAKKNRHRVRGVDEEADIDITHAFWRRAKAKSLKKPRVNASQQKTRSTKRERNNDNNNTSQPRASKYTINNNNNNNTRQPRASEYTDDSGLCRFCAETSHKTRDCGFKQAVECWRCQNLGHKAKHCHHFTWN